MSLVLDASVAIAWAYSTEITQSVRDVFERVKARGAWVPAIWRLEVANVLELNVRRGRSTEEFRDSTLNAFASFPIQTDPETSRQAWGATVRLMTKYQLTSYDAAYLELALRRSLPLATLDEDLQAACAEEKVVLLGV